MGSLYQHKALIAQLILSLLLDGFDVFAILCVDFACPSLLADDRWLFRVARPSDFHLAAVANPYCHSVFAHFDPENGFDDQDDFSSGGVLGCEVCVWRGACWESQECELYYD